MDDGLEWIVMVVDVQFEMVIEVKVSMNHWLWRFLGIVRLVLFVLVVIEIL